MPPILRLDQADLALQSFIVRKLHQCQCVNGTVAILPPACRTDPSMPAEYIVQEWAKLWANKRHTAPAVPGGTTKECAALNGVSTCPLEADAGECKVLLMEATFIRFTSTEEEVPNVPNGPADELADHPTDERQDEAVELANEKQDEVADETPIVPPTEEGDNPDDKGDKPNDDLEGGAPSSPERMDTRDDTTTNEEGNASDDSDSDNDLETVTDASSEADTVEEHCKAVLLGEEMIMLSDSDSEDGDSRIRDQLLITNKKLDRSAQHGSRCGGVSDNHDTRHDSGCRETSDGSTVNVRPLPYLFALEELADKQMVAATQLDQNFTYTSISLLNIIEEGFAATGGITKTFVEGMTGLAVNFFKDAKGNMSPKSHWLMLYHSVRVWKD